MDLSAAQNILINNAIFIVAVIFFASILKSAWFKGVLGEWIVNLLIKFCLNKNTYHLIKNVTLPTFTDDKENGTTQIDHIIVSKFGIFVVETKNMKGWIFGNANQKQWTQKLFKQSFKFQNPLHQNYKHIKTLAALTHELGIDNKECIFSVIIFIGDSTFKTKMPDNVRFARGGIEYIKSKTEEILTNDQVASIIQQIESGRLTRGFKTNRQHVKHVKEIVKEKSDTKSCTKCNAEMVLRKATKGKNAGNEFWGCSAFPKCRNVVEIG